MILDVGSGVWQRGDINIDISRGKNFDHSKFVRADAHCLPFRDNVFSKVISFHVIEHLENPFKFLDECVRVSKSIILIRCPHQLSLSAKYCKTHRWVFNCSWFRKYAEKKELGCKAIIRLDAERSFWVFPLECYVILWILKNE